VTDDALLGFKVTDELTLINRFFGCLRCLMVKCACVSAPSVFTGGAPETSRSFGDKYASCARSQRERGYRRWMTVLDDDD
jgi:hypothetical protein